VCTQDDTLDPDFSVRDNLWVFARYFRPRRPDLARHIDGLLERFGLARFADHRPDQLSGGYRRRLMIARSIVHDPDVLFLDEPTTGLDPKARVELWALVAELRALGMAIILTTHYMDEAERLSDRLVVLQRGEVLAAGLPREVLGGLLGEHTLVLPPDAPERDDVAAWAEREGVPTQDVLGELRLMVEGPQLAAFTTAFPRAPLHVRPPNLDDLFLSLSEGDAEAGGPTRTGGDLPAVPGAPS
jgi:lipooligosaccharide transport system ATP-binding protein